MLIVQAGEDDRHFLFEMFLQAAFWWNPRPDFSCASVKEDPALGPYVRDWGRPDDAALVARDGHRIGAAWYRLFPAEEPGYGFVDEATPELGIAVVPSRRGTGIGASLLRALTAHARDSGFTALSLSVSTENPARRLYTALGFEPLHEVGRSVTMRLEL